jgi:putative component of membrane protein insertase Oxa1/YidC/SpoIIIJ protein YidD
MPLAHAAHDLLYTGPAAVTLTALALATWRSARRARRCGPAVMGGASTPRAHAATQATASSRSESR